MLSGEESEEGEPSVSDSSWPMTPGWPLAMRTRLSSADDDPLDAIGGRRGSCEEADCCLICSGCVPDRGRGPFSGAARGSGGPISMPRPERPLGLDMAATPAIECTWFSLNVRVRQ